MDIITEDQVLDRTRLIRRADVIALLGDDYAKAYDKGWKRAKQGEHGDDLTGAAWDGFDACHSGWDKWNHEGTRESILAVFAAREAAKEQAVTDLVGKWAWRPLFWKPEYSAPVFVLHCHEIFRTIYVRFPDGDRAWLVADGYILLRLTPDAGTPRS